jgi:hypothetical protein
VILDGPFKIGHGFYEGDFCRLSICAQGIAQGFGYTEIAPTLRVAGRAGNDEYFFHETTLLFDGIEITSKLQTDPK